MFLFDHSRGKKKSNDTICFISTTTDMLVNYAIIRYVMKANFYFIASKCLISKLKFENSIS